MKKKKEDFEKLLKNIIGTYNYKGFRPYAFFVKTLYKTFGTSAFRKCESIESVYIPSFDDVSASSAHVPINAFYLCANPKHVVDYYADRQLDFVSFEHPLRSSVVAEAASCHFWAKDDTASLARDLAQKYNGGEVKDDILFETMVCLAKPGDAQVKATYEKWWSLIVQGSKRDQLSLPFAVKSTPELRHGFLPKPIATSPWFARTKHWS